MKRLFLLLLALGLSFALARLGQNVWSSTRFFEEHGRDASLVIGKRYNHERWAPVPVKKVYTYTARLEPEHEVLVETDQELNANDVLPIRFLTRDLGQQLRASSLRPQVNSLRLRGPNDEEPVKVADTDLFDNLRDKAMGPPAPGVYLPGRQGAESAPERALATVPFVFTDGGTGTGALLWRNSRIGEWVLVLLFALAVPALLSSFWERHLAARRPNPNRRDFVHPSLKKIEADAVAAPSAKLTYVPRPDEEIALPEPEKRRMAEEAARKNTAPPAPPAQPAPAPPEPALAPAPAAPSASAPGPAPTLPPTTPSRSAPRDLPSLAANETAPPMPFNRDEPALKLRRKNPGQ
jgi:hypothetical protein